MQKLVLVFVVSGLFMQLNPFNSISFVVKPCDLSSLLIGLRTLRLIHHKPVNLIRIYTTSYIVCKEVVSVELVCIKCGPLAIDCSHRICTFTRTLLLGKAVVDCT